MSDTTGPTVPVFALSQLLDALPFGGCVFCGYNGEGYFQPGHHASFCPWRNIGGHAERVAELPRILHRLGQVRSGAPVSALAGLVQIPAEEQVERLVAALREAEAALSMLPCSRQLAARQRGSSRMPMACPDRRGQAFICVRCGAWRLVAEALVDYPPPIEEPQEHDDAPGEGGGAGA